MPSRFFVALLLALCALTGAPFVASAQATDTADATTTPAETPAQKALRLANEAAEEARAKAAAAAQQQITDTNNQIKALKDQIAALQKDLNSTTAQKQTLQTAIKALDLQIQKLQKNVALTTAQISQKDREITNLSGNISDTEKEIAARRTDVGLSLRRLDQADQEEWITSLLGGGTLSGFFDETISLESMRIDLQRKIQGLSALRNDLQDSKNVAENKRKELAALKTNLNQTKQGITAAKADQTNLLTQTKNKESSYQALIAQKQAEEAQFEQDLQDFEAQLGLVVAAGSLPPVVPGILQWPLETIRITQYFGNTDFATKNPQVYGGHGHTGVDFAASTGTRVLAARGGIVLGTGNTDLTCPNASYGKWVFIKHDNGLSTLYAHLSTISVTQGQQLAVGDVVGYSGSTGYATGPHLHFGVYATSGSEIASFSSASCKGKTYTMPVGALKAYLNPLSYLPTAKP